MNMTYDRIQRIIDALKKRAPQNHYLDDVRFAPGYAEPGYDEPAAGIVAIANWNDCDGDASMSRLADLLEHAGVSIEWCDEWIECDDCMRTFRTSTDGPGWQMSGVIDEEGCYCMNCIDAGDYLRNLEGKDRKCNTISRLNPAEHGYQLIADQFENGLYDGQAASPRKIASALRAAGFARYVFNLDSTGQFDVQFSVWLHDDEAENGGLERARAALRTADTNEHPSPADRVKAALRGMND